MPQGTFTITAAGAQGGSNQDSFLNGGSNFGASVEGTFAFQASTNLIILVGGRGTSGSDQFSDGGGGGSFVYIDVNNDNAITSVDTLLLAAGGGGGDGAGNSPGIGGTSSNSGSGSGQGGAAGAAGNITFFGDTSGGGGAGIDGGGGSGSGSGSFGPQYGSGAPSITAGGSGSFSGFGGGGSGASGGGGGGYTGGNGGDGAGSQTRGGGGGTSYIAPEATSTSSTASTNQGDGVVSITCFATGTRIGTARGEVAVEALLVGDLAVTASGEARPIRWIGHRTYRCRGRQDALPVRIALNAFGEGRPARDLLVSPAHAIAVDVLGEVLIPACRLVNGTTITQVDVEAIIYWHVELDSHDILLAKGLPAESYLDCGNRRFFANAEATDLAALPDARPEGPLPFCRPFHEAGPLVDLVRARLQDRAEALGWHKVEDAVAGLHLVADGRTIRPDMQGLTARFVVPAEARDVRLVSETSVPAHVVWGSSDDRRLGVALAALSIDDGLTRARAVALDDARLGEGLYGVNGTARWTNGSAVLPAALWDGCKGTFFLRVTLAGPALPRWIAPGETAGLVSLAERREA